MSDESRGSNINVCCSMNSQQRSESFANDKPRSEQKMCAKEAKQLVVANTINSNSDLLRESRRAALQRKASERQERRKCVMKSLMVLDVVAPDDEEEEKEQKDDGTNTSLEATTMTNEYNFALDDAYLSETYLSESDNESLTNNRNAKKRSHYLRRGTVLSTDIAGMQPNARREGDENDFGYANGDSYAASLPFNQLQQAKRRSPANGFVPKRYLEQERTTTNGLLGRKLPPTPSSPYHSQVEFHPSLNTSCDASINSGSTNTTTTTTTTSTTTTTTTTTTTIASTADELMLLSTEDGLDRRYLRRGSVTKYSLDAKITAMQPTNILENPNNFARYPCQTPPEEASSKAKKWDLESLLSTVPTEQPFGCPPHSCNTSVDSNTTASTTVTNSSIGTLSITSIDRCSFKKLEKTQFAPKSLSSSDSKLPSIQDNDNDNKFTPSNRLKRVSKQAPKGKPKSTPVHYRMGKNLNALKNYLDGNGIKSDKSIQDDSTNDTGSRTESFMGSISSKLSNRVTSGTGGAKSSKPKKKKSKKLVRKEENRTTGSSIANDSDAAGKLISLAVQRMKKKETIINQSDHGSDTNSFKEQQLTSDNDHPDRTDLQGFDATRNDHDDVDGPKPKSTPERRKRVRFGEIIITEFPIILGDNPAVTSGAPVTIGWIPQGELSCAISVYENARGRQRRRRKKLILTVSNRAIMLLAAGYTIDEIADASINAQQIKNYRIASMQYQSWDRLTMMMETTNETLGTLMESTGKRLKAIVKPTQHSESARTA